MKNAIAYKDLLVMLAGLKVVTPEKGFTSDGQIRATIEAGLNDAHKRGVDEGTKLCPHGNVHERGFGSCEQCEASGIPRH